MNAFVKLCLPLIFILCYFTEAVPTSNDRKQLLYILIDGFRYDYVDMQPSQNLPGFSRFLKGGVKSEWMKAIFPSISYPDWTTLATGLYPESHGLVGNFIYDAQEKDSFSLFDADATGKRKWWTAEPIWITATKSQRSTAVYFWSRCDVPFDAVTPDICEPFVKKTGPQFLRHHIDNALDKLQDGFHFVMVYNEHADNVGHDSGPETDDMKIAVREVDSTILHLLDELKNRNLEDNVNIVIVSDHGMVDTAPGGTTNRVEIDDYLNLDYVEKIVDAGAAVNIKVVPGRVDEVFNSLQAMPGVEVYRHDDIPDKFHFKNHKYIHDIIIKANIGTWIMRSKSPDKMLPPRDDTYTYFGAHGFDPDEEKMRAIFFAKGPDFKKDATINPINNVDVYPLLAHLLGITPKPNNGTFAKISSALIETPKSEAPTINKIAATILLFSILVLSF